MRNTYHVTLRPDAAGRRPAPFVIDAPRAEHARTFAADWLHVEPHHIRPATAADIATADAAGRSADAYGWQPQPTGLTLARMLVAPQPTRAAVLRDVHGRAGALSRMARRSTAA